MNDLDKIKAIQQELVELQQQLQKQNQKILILQKKLNELTGDELKVKKAVLSDGRWSVENFIGLRIIHFIGIIVLVIGLSIGVKYAIDRELISEGMRIILAYTAGLVLYFLSVRLKSKYIVFSAILLSGALASLYFTTYGAHVYYQMFSFGLAFTIMIALTVYTVYEAIRYGRQEIALLGLVGAYAIPFLISRNAERADLFFLYISLINLAVVFLCFRKKWKTIASVSQAITWILFIAWAGTRYNPGQEWIGFLFMVYFFIVFHFAILAFSFFYKQTLLVNDTYGLVLNNVALYISAAFIFGRLNSEDDHLAIITFLVSFFIALQAYLVNRFWRDEIICTKMLSLLSLALFVFFVALYWDGFTVTFLWLLTAIVIFIWGFRIRSVPARLTAMVLIGLTLAKLLVIDSSTFSTIQKVIAYLVLGVLLLVVSFFYQKFRKQLFNEE
jgi:uncharacterized membrane protein